jgi:TolB-like protein/DNA-binding winged helix-turn-helix (wHTH) protein
MPQTGSTSIEHRDPFRLGDWLVEPLLNRLTRGDESVHLEPRAMDLLVFLAQHPGEVLSRETLIDGVWAEQFVGEAVLRQTIAALRDALGDDAREPTFIETIPKRGYRLIAAVAEVEPPVEQETGRPAARFPGLRRVVWVAVGAALLLAVIVALLWHGRQAPPAGPKRIVVLPFENLGPPEDEYFADGMTEEIISRLAAVSDLHVISRTSAMYFKGTAKKLSEIGDELGVDYALEGTVRWDRSGDGEGRVRITPQLIQVDGDRHLWSERYDEVIEDIFELQSDIAQRRTLRSRSPCSSAPSSSTRTLRWRGRGWRKA